MFPTRRKHSLHTALYAVSLAMYRNAKYKFFSAALVLVLALTGSKRAAMWCLAAGWGETTAVV